MSLIKEALHIKKFPSFLVGTLALLLGVVIGPANRFVASFLLLGSAFFVYLYCVFVQTKRNWWDIRALFSAIWLGTNALAVLRLTGYQVLWEPKTWVCQAIAYAAFHIGIAFGEVLGSRIPDWIKEYAPKKISVFRFIFQQKRLFWICFFITLFGMFCLVMNVLARGFIPYFVAGGGNDYLNFYTKWYLFAVAATMIGGLDYYVLKTQKLSSLQKVFLWFSILYSTIVFPILVVNRSALLTAALSFITAFYYLNKKKFLSLLLCAVVYLFAFGACTNARGYSEAQLNVFFEPIKVEISQTTTNPTTDVSSPSEPTSEDAATEPSTEDTATEPFTEDTVSEPSSAETTESPDSTPDKTEPSGFQLSGTASFIYSYLTVSHDNLNEAVRNDVTYTYGLRQLAPFNVILRISEISETVSKYPHYKVREHLNTVNIIGDAYYDLGLVGVGILMLIWAFAFGLIQSFYLKTSGVFSMLALGNIMTPVVLCFFAPWLSIFSFWMHSGLVFLMCLATYVSIEKNK